jgi:sporulation-control protein spo0M
MKNSWKFFHVAACFSSLQLFIVKSYPIPQIGYIFLSSYWCSFGLHLDFANCEKAAMNTHVQVYVQESIFIPLGKYLVMEWLVYMVG